MAEEFAEVLWNVQIWSCMQRKMIQPLQNRSTAPVTEVTIAYPLRLLAEIREGQPWPNEPRRQQTDLRVHTRPKLVDCPFWTAYGGRGCFPQAGHGPKRCCALRTYIVTFLHSTVHTSSVSFRVETKPLLHIASVIQIFT